MFIRRARRCDLIHDFTAWCRGSVSEKVWSRIHVSFADRRGPPAHPNRDIVEAAGGEARPPMAESGHDRPYHGDLQILPGMIVEEHAQTGGAQTAQAKL